MSGTDPAGASLRRRLRAGALTAAATLAGASVALAWLHDHQRAVVAAAALVLAGIAVTTVVGVVADAVPAARRGAFDGHRRPRRQPVPMPGELAATLTDLRLATTSGTEAYRRLGDQYRTVAPAGGGEAPAAVRRWLARATAGDRLGGGATQAEVEAFVAGLTAWVEGAS